MNKQELLSELRKKLSGLTKDDIDERLTFYSEIIEDRIEEGVSEEEAVTGVGSVDDIVAQTIKETPFRKIVKERIKPKRRLKVWVIILLVLGSPIWLSLGIAVAAVILSLYISLISLWSVFVSLAGCFVGSILAGAVIVFKSNVLSGLSLISAGIVCAGLSIFMFFGCKSATKGILILTKKIAIFIKNCFIKKEEA